MEKILPLVFVLFQLNCFSQANEQETRRNNPANAPSIAGYISGDSIQQVFCQLNQAKFEKLRNAFSALPIDRCHHGRLSMTMFIDSLGEIAYVKLLSGVSNKMLDSAIIDSTINFPEVWNCLSQNGNKIGFKGTFAFELYNILHISGSTRTEGIARDANGTVSQVITHSRTSGNDYSKKCEDADFFYNQGIEEFKKLNYKRAIYNFSYAVSNNPYDLDALHYLAEAYLKVSKVKDACDCLKKSFEYGDRTVEELIQKNCNGISK